MNKDDLNFAYSTDPNYKPNQDEEAEALENNQQNLKVFLDRKNRKGKVVTIITGLIGSNDDYKDMERKFKSQFGVGGSSKNKEIIIQGDYADKILAILKKEDYNVKRSGG
ncbi:MAG: translation initiation factor [Flavobacteriales bacterium]|nr:translation initiation factor [Flavobacteriales bacterium]